MSRFFSRLACRAAFLLITTYSCVGHSAESVPDCSPHIGRIVSIQGNIELRRAGVGPWHAVHQLDVPICVGDVVHSGPRSRSALVLAPETTIRLDQNASALFRAEGDEVQVEMFADAQLRRSQVGKACGTSYFITRFPRKFKVYTPFLNATVEGTEFQMALACERAELSVFEGRVAAESVIAQLSRVVLASGQTISAGPGDSSTSIKAIVRPSDAVEWALFYPATTDREASSPGECTTLDRSAIPTCQALKAEESLRVGRVEEAQQQIKALMELAPLSAEGVALSSVIALVKNDKKEALDLAQRAVERSHQSSRAWLALSYARQAHFELDKALDAARRAEALSPRSALIMSRVAELLMSVGDLKEAERIAQQAVDISPRESRARTVLGFVHLATIRPESAQSDFAQAIELDSSDPLPRLGLGLAFIRKGRLAEGREQIEIAVVLDPTNSLLRSYVGKAYYEENTKERDVLAGTQFELARKLDVNDPTPYFYDAILKQTQNRPAQALTELQTSIEKNDNRAVYRSRLLLDQDVATRASSVARTYHALGFDQAGLSVASTSLSEAPDSHSAHRFLADAYAALPGHEIGRGSELLQSKLLQPLSAFGPQPCMTDADTFIKRPASPEAGYAELSELFERDGLRVFADGARGDHGILDYEGALTGVYGKLAFGLYGCRRSDSGFRENERYDRQLYGGSLQYAVTPDFDVQAEINRDDRQFGDLVYGFDPTAFSKAADNDVAIKSARLGAHLRISAASHFVFSYIAAERINSFFTESPGEFDYRRQVSLKSRQLEGQYIGRLGPSRLNAGFGGGRVNSTDQDTFRDFLTPSETSTDTRRHSEQYQAYIYARTPLTSTLMSTIGVTYDVIQDDPIDQKRFNPKIGLRWTPNSALTVRAAAFRSARRFLVQNQTIEPTEIAGFNQFFDDYSGARAERFGLGVDLKVSNSWLLGAEVSQRDLQVPVLTGNGWIFEPQREQLVKGYLYGSLTRNLALAFDPSFEHFYRSIQDPFDNLANQIDTLQLPLTIKAFTSQGLVVALTGRFVQQYVDRLPDYRTQSSVGTESYTLFDLSIAYRLPRRKAIISFEIRNLTDHAFRYQDYNIIRRSEISPAGIFPERTAWVRGSVQF